ncbi:MAG: dienelactone hydrolase family protein [Candidatus Baltobacteraceae bacterium]
MNSGEIAIPCGSAQLPAYLARPDEQSGPHPAVIVLQDVFGFTAEVKRVAELLASTGYVGLAIDYYHRTNPQMREPYTVEGSRNAFAAAAQVQAADTQADVLAALAWLNAQPFVKPGRVALWGMGFGAALGLQASSCAELCGAVLFYPTSLEVQAPPAIPLLALFGAHDYYVSRHQMESFARRIAPDAGRVQIYPEVGHSFFRLGRPQAVAEHRSYSDEAVAQAVADAWSLAQVFLRDIFSRSPLRAAVTGDIRTPHTQQSQS